MCKSSMYSRATVALTLVLLACGPAFAGKENGELRHPLRQLAVALAATAIA